MLAVRELVFTEIAHLEHIAKRSKQIVELHLHVLAHQLTLWFDFER